MLLHKSRCTCHFNGMPLVLILCIPLNDSSIIYIYIYDFTGAKTYNIIFFAKHFTIQQKIYLTQVFVFFNTIHKFCLTKRQKCYKM
jgi:hypothetical protein